MNLTSRGDPARDMMVVVDKAYKRYTPYSVVLRGLNMNVPTGTIYGLLGPSGCGKTTLLSCIVGRGSLDSGNISVNVKSKRSIGYMPQISRGGGQGRRLSLMIALLHDPKLLILDEPTVGVDPVLSASIWQHLLTICATGKKTVIITTHYIEEARQAHTIGLMRGGTLLAEESPNQLMARYNCNNLEQAFLELSKKQSIASGTQDETVDVTESYPSPEDKKTVVTPLQSTKYISKARITQAFLELSKKQSIASGTQDETVDVTESYPSPEDKKTVVTPLQSTKYISKARITAQLVKNYYWMKRNKPIMCFLLLLPLVQCFLFCTCIGRDPRGLKLAVVNHEFEGGLDRCMQYPSRGCNLSYPLSCRYVENIRKKTIVITEFPDIASAKEAVRHNRAWGLIYFAQNYTEALIERISEKDKASKMAMELSDVHIYQDMSNQYIGNLMRRDLLMGYVDFLQDLFRDCGWPPQVADIPILMEPAIYGNNNPSFVHFTAPAIISLFEFYLPMIFTVGAILMEKMAGLLERSLVAGRDPRGLKLAVVNHEFEGGLDRCMQYPSRGCNLSYPLSCRYVENIRKKTIVITEFPDIASAKEAVRHNRAWGLIYFAQNYTEALIERISEKDKASKMAMELSDVHIYQDMSSKFKNVMEPAIYGNNNPSFVHFTAPAIISLFEFYLPMIFTVGAILMEKMAGLLERSLVAGITIPEVILSHIVVQLVVLVIQTAIMMFVLFVLFDNPLIGSIPWSLTLLLSIGLAGMCYGFMVAILCDTDTAATFMGLGTFFPLAMLSGMIWPLEGMHWILRSVGWALPLTLPTEAFRGISARNWPVTHPTVYKGFLSSLGWIGFFLLMTYSSVKLKKGLRAKSK
ncbi:ABC transporter G family member 23-like [Diaphorina citri]|uniref:ABC transporter G family member 23-like n=1 Tax=Diaphorina citri TaxID=121845 RepID=A0A3Q0J7K4_DIACI|nr:ABC transporter G family member 23-like [Diaphorina citri]